MLYLGVYKLFSQGGECIKDKETELKHVIVKRVVCTVRCSPDNLMLCVSACLSQLA